MPSVGSAARMIKNGIQKSGRCPSMVIQIKLTKARLRGAFDERSFERGYKYFKKGYVVQGIRACGVGAIIDDGQSGKINIQEAIEFATNLIGTRILFSH